MLRGKATTGNGRLTRAEQATGADGELREADDNFAEEEEPPESTATTGGCAATEALDLEAFNTALASANQARNIPEDNSLTAMRLSPLFAASFRTAEPMPLVFASSKVTDLRRYHKVSHKYVF